MFSNFCPKSRAGYGDNVEKWGRAKQATDDNVIRRMRFSRWIPRATDTHSENVILIVFPLQQWLHERAPMLRYTCIVFLINISIQIW